MIMLFLFLFCSSCKRFIDQKGCPSKHRILLADHVTFMNALLCSISILFGGKKNDTSAFFFFFCFSTEYCVFLETQRMRYINIRWPRKFSSLFVVSSITVSSEKGIKNFKFVRCFPIGSVVSNLKLLYKHRILIV